jgi:acetoin utilization deacetylase AcuC-like enzyme
LHEFPAYPGSGWIDEHGIGDAAWTTVNVPLPAGAGSDVYRAAVESLAVPVVEQFAPDWILVSAGYDAHRADPLADLRLEADDYALMAGLLAKVVPPGRLLLYLEGGYDLEAVEASVAATLAGAAGKLDPEPPAEGEQSSQSAWHMLDLAREAASARWEVV